MINVLIPMASRPNNFDNHQYPTPLIEIAGVPMIQRVIENLKSIGDVHFVFVVQQDDCVRYHLDNTLKLLTEDKCSIVEIEKSTKGAACSALMAIKEINNALPLIIANSDQIFSDDLTKHIRYFETEHADAGCLVFDSVHPRWSYVKVKEDKVIEAAEKNPISKNAVAGFYYYGQGRFFTEAAMEMMRKEAVVNDMYYIAPTFNELILQGKKVLVSRIDNEKYFSFYTPQRIADYEQRLAKKKEGL